ncbi:MAG: phosphatidylcholine/phosphatidylserine synthase [Pseudomonadota bacterium]
MTEPARRKVPELPLFQLLPNMITVAALCAGLTALRAAFNGEFGQAVILIIIAAVLDGLDGRLARLLRSESKIGAELDSLCDFVNFGVVPGIVLYLWALGNLPRVGWIATLIYIACCLLRLARFNTDTKAAVADGEHADGSFVGVPSPAGAMLALLPIFLAFLFEVSAAPPTGLVAAWMVIVGTLMIGTFPTPSLKGMSVARERATYVVISFVAVLALLTAYPWATLAALDLGYLAMLGWTQLARLRRPKA